MQPPGAVCQLNYAEWSAIDFSASLKVTYTGGHRQARSFPHRLNHMWLCISKLLSVSPLLFVVPVWCRVAGKSFWICSLCNDIKDTIRNVFDHEKSVNIQVPPPSCSHHLSLFKIKIWDAWYNRRGCLRNSSVKWFEARTTGKIYSHLLMVWRFDICQYTQLPFSSLCIFTVTCVCYALSTFFTGFSLKVVSHAETGKSR